MTRERDNLAIHRPIDDAQPGDAPVINGLGGATRVLFGDLLAQICLTAGIAIDGASLNERAIAKLGPPAWSRAITPAGPTKTGPGSMGFPVASGGVVVAPGR